MNRITQEAIQPIINMLDGKAKRTMVVFNQQKQPMYKINITDLRVNNSPTQERRNV
jgi:uncharacterized protein (UPF0218 family)